jgi:uncharacterized membrane protein
MSQSSLEKTMSSDQSSTTTENDNEVEVSTGGGFKTFATAQLPLLVIMGLIAWLAWDGKAKAKKCLDKAPAESDNAKKFQTSVLVNDLSFGIAIGVGIGALIPDVLIGPISRYGLAAVVGTMAGITINSYSKLDCADDSILTQKEIMYMALGASIGIFINAILIQTIEKLPTKWKARVPIMIFSVYVIVLSSFNINFFGKCDDTVKEKKDMKNFRTANIVYVSIASLVTLVVMGSAIKGK